jgi:site-specific DNA-methyltransferase (adenine-specific)
MATATPYYQDDFATIYHGDCREVLPSLLFEVIVTDPPYGVSEPGDRRSRGRGNAAECNDFPDVYGDDKPFDPQWLLDFGRPTVLFGANHFCERVPSASRWLVWDKLDGLQGSRDIGFNDNADAELAWTNLGGPVRLFGHRWKGMLKSSERGHRRVHPTQKPVPLMSWVLRQCPEGRVADPFMGSGTTLRAAKDLGRHSIGIEIEERYCEIAAKRLAQEVLDFGGVA